jgi:hypothetical protein
MEGLTAGQASYVIDRLLADRRVSAAEINRYLGEMQDEIAAITAKIERLRGIATPSAPAPNPPLRGGPAAALREQESAPVPTARRRKMRLSPATRAMRKEQGSYIGYLRQVSERERRRFQRIREMSGYGPAIQALRAYLGK